MKSLGKGIIIRNFRKCVCSLIKTPSFELIILFKKLNKKIESTAMIRNRVGLAFNAYNHSLGRHPLMTKMMTSAVLFSLGDWLCQRTEAAFCGSTPAKHTEGETRSNWDMNRTLRQGLIGGLFLSPGLHYFLTRVMTCATFPSLSRATNIGLRVGLH